MEKIKIIATDYTICTDVDYYIKGESTYETLGCIYNKEMAEYIVQACNEYPKLLKWIEVCNVAEKALKEEKEKLKYENDNLKSDKETKELLIKSLSEERNRFWEENEKLKTEHLKVREQDYEDYKELDRQRDELAEMLQEMFQAADKLLIHKWIYDNRNKVQLLLNRIKESANIKEG